MTFESLGIKPELLKGIEELGFTEATPIQQEIIPLVFETENDVVGLAQTGTGKTAAFGLPLIQNTDMEDPSVQTLILAPTRELCIQITSDLNLYTKHIRNFSIVSVYGGAAIDKQINALKKGAQVIVATPGRMVDLLKRKIAKLGNIKNVVLDEADEMLNMGFRDDLNTILDKTPENKRVLLFSATMPNEVAKIASTYMKDPVKITVGKQNQGAENIKHIYYQVHAKDRYLALKRIADVNPNIYGLVFCRTRQETKDVADKLIRDGYNADALHGDLSQSQRDHVMKRFRNRSLQMLVATDVAARGIDVNEITHVINYNLPEENEIYNHRTGRTGRAGRSGVAVSIVNYREKSRIPVIEKMINKKFEKHPVPTGKEICEKQLFKLIDNMENVSVDEKQIEPFMDKVNKKLEWLSKEDIIKNFVSLEFNRFLDYYKNAPDLNEKEIPSGGKKKRKSNAGREKGNNYNDSNFSRFFINIGKKDKAGPRELMGIINRTTRRDGINIGAIDMKDSFSFFEADSTYAPEILDQMNNNNYNGREIRVELAEKPKAKNGRKKGKSNKKKN